MRLAEALGLSVRLTIATSSYLALLLTSLPIALLSHFVCKTGAINMIPLLAMTSGLAIIEYGKRTIMQLLYLMLLSGARPGHFNLLKALYSLLVSLPLSLSTLPSGRVETFLLTLLLVETSSTALLSHYLRKVKRGL